MPSTIALLLDEYQHVALGRRLKVEKKKDEKKGAVQTQYVSVGLRGCDELRILTWRKS